MDVRLENLNKGRVKLIIELKPDEMVGFFNKTFKKVSQSVKIDGFRPGKAPRKLIESSIGISRLLSEGLDRAISDSYTKAVRDNKLIPVSSPKVVINKYPNYGQSVDEVKEIFEFEIELEVLPDVRLEDYSKVKVKKTEPKTAAKKDVEKVLLHFQKQNSSFADLSRPAEKGDRVEVSFEGYLKGVRIDQMSSKNHPLVLGEGSLIPGFEENLIGLKKGDKKEFKLTFPKDYHAKEYADEEALFKAEIIDVKEVQLPKLDDNFAEKFGHKDVEALKTAIEKNLNDELREESERNQETQVLDAVLPYLKVELPDSLIDREAERMIADFNQQLIKQGLNFDFYLKSTKKDRETLKKEMLPQAEKNVKVGLLLGKIIDENKWDPQEDNVGKRAIKLLAEKIVK